MMSLVLAGLLLAIAAGPVFAEAPAGFAEFPWGTSPAVLRHPFLVTRCGSSTENLREGYVICHQYRVEGLNVSVLRLDFEPADALTGYSMVVARSSYRALRDVVIKRFGSPVRRSFFGWGGQEWWEWPGVSATLLHKCGEDVSCLEVTTAALDRRREQARERQRRDLNQSF